MPRKKPALPPIPSRAVLHDRATAAKILTQHAGRGWSYDSLTRLIESDWADYEGVIWCDCAPRRAKNRRIRIWVEGVMGWLRLPAKDR